MLYGLSEAGPGARLAVQSRQQLENLRTNPMRTELNDPFTLRLQEFQVHRRLHVIEDRALNSEGGKR